MRILNIALLVISAGLFQTAYAESLTGDTIPIPEVPHGSADRLAPINAGKPIVTISREECVSIALQDNPTIKVADLEVKRVEYAKKETRGSLLPQIDFQLAYQRAIELQTIRMNFGGQSQSIKMGSDNSWNTGFSVSLPIIAPTLWKAISLNETQILQNLESARASRLDMVNNVNKAYYALMLALASREVIAANYDIAIFNAQLFEKQYEVGTASEFDVLRSSVQVKNIEPELLNANLAIRQCQLQLMVLMGMNDDVYLMPNVSLADMQREMYAYPIETELSLEDNSSLRSLDLAAKLAKQNVDLKKFAYLPTLGASYSLSWSALSNGNPLKDQHFNPYSNVALAINVPIFSGGSRYYGVKQAEVQVKEIALQRENLLNALRMQTDVALENIKMEIKQIATSEESVKQAGKAYSIMQKSFEIGAASYLDLRDSELANTAAQLGYYNAIYNYLVSTSELDLLLGKEKAAGI